MSVYNKYHIFIGHVLASLILSMLLIVLYYLFDQKYTVKVRLAGVICFILINFFYILRISGYGYYINYQIFTRSIASDGIWAIVGAVVILTVFLLFIFGYISSHQNYRDSLMGFYKHRNMEILHDSIIVYIFYFFYVLYAYSSGLIRENPSHDVTLP